MFFAWFRADCVQFLLSILVFLWVLWKIFLLTQLKFNFLWSLFKNLKKSNVYYLSRTVWCQLSSIWRHFSGCRSIWRRSLGSCIRIRIRRSRCQGKCHLATLLTTRMDCGRIRKLWGSIRTCGMWSKVWASWEMLWRHLPLLVWTFRVISWIFFSETLVSWKFFNFFSWEKGAFDLWNQEFYDKILFYLDNFFSFLKICFLRTLKNLLFRRIEMRGNFKNFLVLRGIYTFRNKILM